MSQEDDHRRTIGYGVSALGYIKKNYLPAFPRFYELWYTYVAGFNYKLNNYINEIIGKNGQISDEEMQQIYNKFLSPNRLGDRVDVVGTKVSDEIRELLKVLNKNNGQNSAYSSSLSSVEDQLSEISDSLQLKELIKKLVIATEKSSRANEELKLKLITSKNKIETLRENLETIRYESLTDDLTTLNNRKHFDQMLERCVKDAEETQAPLSLLLSDIDHFKQFNDNFGHQTGDQVLRLVALATKQNVKGQDVACRYGGEEFGIILPHTSLHQAMSVAENIRQSVFSKELVKRSTGENLGRVTISIGVATFKHGDTVHTLLSRADAALYNAKHSGRNLVKSETDRGSPNDAQLA